MTDLSIYSHTDLKNEIYRLQGLEREKGEALKKHFNSPMAIISSVYSLFSSNHSQETDKDGGIFKQDFFGLLSRVALPFALNKTLFRNSNFIIKTLVGLVSQKASHYISEDTVEGAVDTAKGLFGKLIHLFDKNDKKKKPEITSFRKIKKD
jgi:hypothetical protein